MLGADLVERVPDRAVIVEVDAAGEGDLGAGGHEHFGLGAALGGEESRLSIIAEVSARWLTIEPVRGRQAEPV